MPSEAQINASRTNGKLSHGAVTPAGKQASKMNAVTHGLCARTLIIAAADQPAYEQSKAMVFAHYQPVTAMEKSVIQEVADHTWKLSQVPVWESGILANHRRHLGDQFADITDATERHIMEESQLQETCAKALSNLTLQQSRTQRQLEKKIAEFKALRAEREVVEIARRNMAMKSIMGANSIPHPCVGVDFSFQYLAARVEFLHYCPDADVAVFDRTWRVKSQKTPD